MLDGLALLPALGLAPGGPRYHPVVGWALSAISISCLGRAAVGLPAFVAGRINQPQIAEEVLAAELADMCGMTGQ